MSKHRGPQNSPPVDQGTGGNQLRVERRELRVGPLPDPTDLERYEQIVSGAAERIIRMAEAQAEHVHDQAKRLLEANIHAHEDGIRIQRRGQAFAFVMGLAALTATVTTAWADHDGVATALAVSCVVGLVGTFLGGRLAASQEQKGQSG